MEANPRPSVTPEYAADIWSRTFQPPRRLRQRYRASYYAGAVQLLMAPLALICALVTGRWVFWFSTLASLAVSLVTIRGAYRQVRADGDTPHLLYWEQSV